MLMTILLATVLIVSLVINIFLYKALTIQLNKISLYEKWIDEYETWVGDVRSAINNTYLKMRSVDNKEIFFKDDDVGFVFSELLDLLKNINDRIQK